jgi:hypothetical protein
MDDLRYPIGKLQMQKQATPAERQQWIAQIEEAPAKMRAAVRELNDQQLDTPYRPGGWTVRQVVHHVPDSHLNAYIRLRWALTEDAPLIKAYEEARWAELSDARTAPIEMSLTLLESLHSRWVLLWLALGDADWERTWHHPEMGSLNITGLASIYSWHGRHHVAHITSLRQRMHW